MAMLVRVVVVRVVVVRVAVVRGRVRLPRAAASLQQRYARALLALRLPELRHLALVPFPAAAWTLPALLYAACDV